METAIQTQLILNKLKNIMEIKKYENKLSDIPDEIKVFNEENISFINKLLDFYNDREICGYFDSAGIIRGIHVGENKRVFVPSEYIYLGTTFHTHPITISDDMYFLPSGEDIYQLFVDLFRSGKKVIFNFVFSKIGYVGLRLYCSRPVTEEPSIVIKEVQEIKAFYEKTIFNMLVKKEILNDEVMKTDFKIYDIQYKLFLDHDNITEFNQIINSYIEDMIYLKFCKFTIIF